MTRQYVTVEKFVSDLTREEITSGGWELRALSSPDSGREYHFESLSEVAAALLDNPEIFGLSRGKPDAKSDYERHGMIRWNLRRWGVRL